MPQEGLVYDVALRPARDVVCTSRAGDSKYGVASENLYKPHRFLQYSGQKRTDIRLGACYSLIVRVSLDVPVMQSRWRSITVSANGKYISKFLKQEYFSKSLW